MTTPQTLQMTRATRLLMEWARAVRSVVPYDTLPDGYSESFAAAYLDQLDDFTAADLAAAGAYLVYRVAEFADLDAVEWEEFGCLVDDVCRDVEADYQ